MKYIVLLGDGMSDYPIEKLGGKTPLEYAHTPNMDFIADNGLLGLVKTVPEGFPPGSDVANLSVFGYDIVKYYTGRSPLEAASMGVDLGPDDVAFRCNLVTLTEGMGGLIMDDFSGGHISTEEAAKLVSELQGQLGNEEFTFHPGVSYRHLLVWHGGKSRLKTTPPHDISDRLALPHYPQGDGADKIADLMIRSRDILESSDVNKKRLHDGKKPANSIWLWGQGKAPAMPDYKEKYGLSGSVISAVDLLKGIGVYAGLDIVDVPGATGYIDTDYDAKAAYALKELETKDFVYLHVEAPDEAAHSGSLENKIKAIEDFDEKVVGAVLEGIKRLGDFRILLMPDHATPVALRTHTSEPVPFAIYPALEREGSLSGYGYNEKAAEKANLLIEKGSDIMARFLNLDN
ncbi:MAG: cofactor-independent phosphoglycerate mutase [bacterium]|nr:cofactor-independent phosphoglycerate mutase [bacterium]